MAKAKYRCPGAGVPHQIPGAGRMFLFCSRCRWAPTYKEPEPQPVKGA